MKTKLGKVMGEELFVEEDNYSENFRDFLIDNERINVNLGKL